MKGRQLFPLAACSILIFSCSSPVSSLASPNNESCEENLSSTILPKIPEIDGTLAYEGVVELSKRSESVSSGAYFLEAENGFPFPNQVGSLIMVGKENLYPFAKGELNEVGLFEFDDSHRFIGKDSSNVSLSSLGEGRIHLSFDEGGSTYECNLSRAIPYALTNGVYSAKSTEKLLDESLEEELTDSFPYLKKFIQSLQKVSSLSLTAKGPIISFSRFAGDNMDFHFVPEKGFYLSDNGLFGLAEHEDKILFMASATLLSSSYKGNPSSFVPMIEMDFGKEKELEEAKDLSGAEGDNYHGESFPEISSKEDQGLYFILGAKRNENLTYKVMGEVQSEKKEEKELAEAKRGMVFVDEGYATVFFPNRPSFGTSMPYDRLYNRYYPENGQFNLDFAGFSLNEGQLDGLVITNTRIAPGFPPFMDGRFVGSEHLVKEDRLSLSRTLDLNQAYEGFASASNNVYLSKASDCPYAISVVLEGGGSRCFDYSFSNGLYLSDSNLEGIYVGEGEASCYRNNAFDTHLLAPQFHLYSVDSDDATRKGAK